MILTSPLLFISPQTSYAQEPFSGHSIAVYTGLGSPTPLHDMVLLKALDLTNDGILTVAYNYRFWQIPDLMGLEAETSITKHFEELSLFSFAGAFVVRWIKTPWYKALGGSFGFGNGLSYANGIPNLEGSRLDQTSRWLYHLYFEVTLPLPWLKKWDFLFRIHHRSGIFGIFGGTVGGSDYISIGTKYYF